MANLKEFAEYLEVVTDNDQSCSHGDMLSHYYGGVSVETVTVKHFPSAHDTPVRAAEGRLHADKTQWTTPSRDTINNVHYL